jgi:maltose/moltooligosaccharide transporter
MVLGSNANAHKNYYMISRQMSDSTVDIPRLRFSQLWDMNFGNLGIQFGWGLQMANMAAIYTKLGAHSDALPILGLAGPVTGLLVQPVIGAMSDRTWSARLGRRRPYFTVGAIAASTILYFMPSSPRLWVAAVLLWVLDASINISMEPFRAFVADKLPLRQRAAGFLMQSFFIGLGATLANMLPWVLHRLGVTSESTNGVPLSVLYSFRVGAFALIGAVMWTVLRTPESAPSDSAAFERHRQSTKGIAAICREIKSACTEMPHTMRQLFWVQFLTWYGIACVWTMLTLAIAKNIFGVTNSHNVLFDRATEWSGVCLAAMSVFCFLFSPVMSLLARSIGRPLLHGISLGIGGVGFLCIAFIHTQTMMFLPMVGYGIAWASIMALPYAILSVSLPAARTGVYMGIFNFFIVLPQIAYALTMPVLIKFAFAGDPIKPIVVGGICLVVAGLLATRVVEFVPPLIDEPFSPESIKEFGDGVVVMDSLDGVG